MLPSIATLSQASAAPISGDDRVVHVLNRLTFGPKPGDIEEVKKIGVDAYIDQQLSPDKLPESKTVTDFISDSEAFKFNPPALYVKYGPPAQKALKEELMKSEGSVDKKELAKQKGAQYKAIYKDVAQAKLMRALDSPRQLQEVMTDFWFNHFNVSINKGLDHIWIGSYEEQAIRPYALGHFRDLLEATCHHAAMLFYLDNWRNSASGDRAIGSTAIGSNKKDGSNENYARELMELHTLGVDGGYTQKDVTELARILTGLSLPRPKNDLDQASTNMQLGFMYYPKRHDMEDKELLGQTIKGTGPDEIKQALDILAKHPSTAHHISYQLAQYFVADDPPADLVNRLAKKYTETDGNIREILSTLFHSPEFWDSKYSENKYKNPFRFVVSSLRAVDAQPQNYEVISQFLKLQGMPIYGCLTPDGYKNTESAWLNPDALIRRVNFASAVGTNKLPGLGDNTISYDNLRKTVGSAVSQQSIDIIAKQPEQLRPALLLGGPDFMKY